MVAAWPDTLTWNGRSVPSVRIEVRASRSGQALLDAPAGASAEGPLQAVAVEALCGEDQLLAAAAVVGVSVEAAAALRMGGHCRMPLGDDCSR